jgi:hypothetical protein
MARYQNIKDQDKENPMSKSVGLNKSVFIEDEEDESVEDILDRSRT